jgi:hypothetical protein
VWAEQGFLMLNLAINIVSTGLPRVKYMEIGAVCYGLLAW